MATSKADQSYPSVEGSPLPAAPRVSATLGMNVTIKGRIVSHADLYFNGEMEGPIEAPRSTVTLGVAANIIANIRARKVIVRGSVQGNIEAFECIELRREGKVTGNLVTPRIVIEDGAYFKGSIDVASQAAENLSPAEVSALEQRYSELIEVKYLRRFSDAEEEEMERLAVRLASVDASFYAPVLERLRRSSALQENAGIGTRAASAG
jgi:cytoskeletal protein CcmA (bactofilin family)